MAHGKICVKCISEIYWSLLLHLSYPFRYGCSGVHYKLYGAVAPKWQKGKINIVHFCCVNRVLESSTLDYTKQTSPIPMICIRTHRRAHLSTAFEYAFTRPTFIEPFASRPCLPLTSFTIYLNHESRDIRNSVNWCKHIQCARTTDIAYYCVHCTLSDCT